MQLKEQVHQLMDEKAQVMSSWQELSAEHEDICSKLEKLQLRSAQLENQLQSSADAGQLTVVV